MSFCTDCKFSRNTSSFIERLLGLKSVWHLKCSRPDLLDEVDGEMTACVTVRLIRCNGQPPKFVHKDSP